MGPLTAQIMKSALTRLDERLQAELTLIVGGGGAMILAHGFPLGTTDIDAIPKGLEINELEVHVKAIANEMQLPKDWLNPYFSTFVHTLPSNYKENLIPVFTGKRVRALALGKNEMLILKCFAHRQKDVGHAKALIKGGANVEAVEAHLEILAKKAIPGTGAALDFLQDVLEQLE